MTPTRKKREVWVWVPEEFQHGAWVPLAGWVGISRREAHHLKAQVVAEESIRVRVVKYLPAPTKKKPKRRAK